MIHVNKNISGLKPSATLAINQKVQELKKQGKTIYHFGFGQSPFPIHPSIVDELKVHASNNHYLPTIGLEALRVQIARFLQKHQNVTVDARHLFIGPGSKELLFQTILVLEGIFLIPKGSWVSYGPQIKLKGGSYTILDTFFGNGFKLTPGILKSFCEKKPSEQKSLLLNSPNNPTGEVYSHDELKSLALVCRQYNIIVLSDEIYSQINFESDCSPSIAQYYPERTIIYGGLSKVFSAGGYRLGFMSLPKDLYKLHTVFRSLFSETFSAVASPIQYAAIEAFKMKDPLKQYIKMSSAILENVSSFIYNNLTSAGLECTYPKGAFYMMIGFNNFKTQLKSLKIYTSEQLAIYLLDENGIALLPSTDFYFEESELFLRLAFVDFEGSGVLKAYSTKKGFIDENFIKEYCPNIFRGTMRLVDIIGRLKNQKVGSETF